MLFFFATATAAIENHLYKSGSTSSFENPFIVTGFNKASRTLTGSISVTRTAPGQTDECRILFSGSTSTPDNVKVRYFEVAAVDGVRAISEIDEADVVHEDGSVKLKLDENRLEGTCEWLLSFVGEPSIKKEGGSLFIAIPQRDIGAWLGVYTVKSERAYFYQNPGGNDIGKAFLVSGDTIHVYDEQPGWYYVKFEGRKKKTLGWIKKTDTVQF